MPISAIQARIEGEREKEKKRVGEKRRRKKGKIVYWGRRERGVCGGKVEVRGQRSSSHCLHGV